MRLLELFLLAGLLHVASGGEGYSDRTQLPRDERQADTIKYLLTLNRQNYLQKLRQPQDTSNSIPVQTPPTIDRPSIINFNQNVRLVPQQEQRTQRIETSNNQRSPPQSAPVRKPSGLLERASKIYSPMSSPSLQLPDVHPFILLRDQKKSRYQERLEKIRESRLQLQEFRSTSREQSNPSPPVPQRSFASNNDYDRDYERSSYTSNQIDPRLTRFRQTVQEKQQFRPTSTFTRPHASSSCDCNELRLENEMTRSNIGKKHSKDDGLAGLINLINREDTEEKNLKNPGFYNPYENEEDTSDQLLSSIIPANEIENEAIIPTYTTTTVLHTKVYDTTLVQEVTREIPILFKGHRITTSIIEKETQIIPTSSIVTATVKIEVTPTPVIQPSPVLPLGLVTGLLTSLPGLKGVPSQPAFPNINPTPSLKLDLKTKNTLDSFQALQSILLKIKLARDALLSSSSLSLSTPTLTSPVASIIQSSAQISLINVPVTETKNLPNLFLTSSVVPFTTAESIISSSVSPISSSINSLVTVLPSRLLQSSLTSTEIESYVQITRSVEPTYVQLSSIIQPTKVESSVYHLSSTISNSATSEDISNDEIKLPTVNEIVNENSNEDTENNNVDINTDNAKESNQNDDEIKVVIVEPVFVRDDETLDNKESIINNEAKDVPSENIVEDTNSETITVNSSLEEDDGVWIISESVSSSVSNADGQVISVQPVFPQNTIPQIIQGEVVTPEPIVADTVDVVDSSVQIVVASASQVISSETSTVIES